MNSSFVELKSSVKSPYQLSTVGIRLDAGYRLDFLAEGQIVIEVKSIEVLTRLHQAQLLTYLKLSGCHVGFLMNFNVVLFRDGLKRILL